MIATLVHYAQQALFNLRTSGLRTGLAILGILVGTAAIVALISCSQLATEKALAEFKTLGTDLIAVSVFQEEPSIIDDDVSAMPLKVWNELPTRISDVLSIAPYNTAYQAVSFQGMPLSAIIIGADESLANLLHIKLIEGHFVSFIESFERFCVIGAALAEQLQELNIENPLGKQLHIGDTLYTIIGIAGPWRENGFFNEDINQAIIIPIAGMALISHHTKINNAILLLNPDSQIDLVIEKLKQVIHMQYPHFNVFVRSAKQIIASMASQGQIFTLLLAVIGGISLLVGGIGVMNVMLVSVSERKKEIGIRKAVGATNHEIQSLFLVESTILSFFGGVLGVVVGLMITWIIAYFSQWTFMIYATPAVVGFIVSLATGMFFGFYPARRAAMLEPMESLRSA